MDAPDNVAAPSAAALMTASGALPASQVGADDGRRAAGGRQEQEALPAPMLRPAAEPMVLPVSVLASPSTMRTRARARTHTHTHTRTHTRTHARTHRHRCAPWQMLTAQRICLVRKRRQALRVGCLVAWITCISCQYLSLSVFVSVLVSVFVFVSVPVSVGLYFSLSLSGSVSLSRWVLIDRSPAFLAHQPLAEFKLEYLR